MCFLLPASGSQRQMKLTFLITQIQSGQFPTQENHLHDSKILSVQMFLLLLVWITRNFSNTEYDSPWTGGVLGGQEHCGQLCTVVGTVESHCEVCGYSRASCDSQPARSFAGGSTLYALHLSLLVQLGNKSLHTSKC